MRRLVIASVILGVPAALLSLANRDVTLLEPLHWPSEVAAFGFAAAVVFWLHRRAPSGPGAPGKGALALALGLVALAGGALLHQSVLLLNGWLGAATPRTGTALVAALDAHAGWDGRTACAVTLAEWRAEAAPLVLAGSEVVHAPAEGAVAACRTAAGDTLRRGERVAVRTRVGGLGLEYLDGEALVPPCDTCGQARTQMNTDPVSPTPR